MKNMKVFISNLMKFIIGFVILIVLLIATSKDNYFGYFLSVLLISLPIIFYSCGKVTIAKTSSLIGMLNPEKGQKHVGKLFYNITRKKYAAYAINIITGLFFGFTIPVYLLRLTFKDLLITTLIIVVAFIVKYFIDNMAPIYDKHHEIKNRILKMRWFDTIVLFLGSIVFGLISWWLYKVDLQVGFFTSVSFENNQIAYAISCVLEGMDSIIDALVNNDAVKNVAKPLYMLIVVLIMQCGMLFFGLVHYFQFFTFKKQDIRCIFIPVEEIVDSISEERKPLFKKKGFLLYFFGLFSIVFIFSSAILWYTMDKKGGADKVAEQLGYVCEEISGSIYKVGTSKLIQDVVGKVFYGETKQALENQINAYFDEMVNSVDDYLDWYYGMSHEILETVSLIYDMVTGKLTDTVDSKMSALMEKGLEEKLIPSTDLKENIDKIVIDGQKKLNDKVDKILEANLITKEDGRYRMVVKTNVQDIFDQTVPGSTIKPSRKLGVSVVVGALAFGTVKASKAIAKRMGNSIGKKIVKEATEEVAEKGIKKATKEVAEEVVEEVAEQGIKKASKAAVKKGVKVGVKKSASKILGGIAGALSGPLAIPVGIAVGVGTEFGMLKLDEVISRNKFKDEVLASIASEREYYLSYINNYFKSSANLNN